MGDKKLYECIQIEGQYYVFEYVILEEINKNKHRLQNSSGADIGVVNTGHMSSNKQDIINEANKRQEAAERAFVERVRRLGEANHIGDPYTIISLLFEPEKEGEDGWRELFNEANVQYAQKVLSKKCAIENTNPFTKKIPSPNIPNIFLMPTEDVIAMTDEEFYQKKKEQLQQKEPFASAVLSAQRFGTADQIKELRGFFIKIKKYQNDPNIGDEGRIDIVNIEALMNGIWSKVRPRKDSIEDIAAIFKSGLDNPELALDSIETLSKNLLLLAGENEGNITTKSPNTEYFNNLWRELEPLLLRERMFDFSGEYIEDETTTDESEMSSEEAMDGDRIEQFVNQVISDVEDFLLLEVSVESKEDAPPPSLSQ